jgi:glycosyltransferase involved in cell wall biosynthesis
MKVALIHDYLREYGGAERVLEALHEIFPNAPIFTAYYNPEGLGVHKERIKRWNIKTSWLQKMPFANRLVSPFRIFAPLIFESFDLKEFDVVISSSAIYFAKAVITKPESLHLSYIHTPPRYLYGYTTSFNYKKNILTRIFGELANHFLRLYDFETSQRPDILIANSENVKERIKKFYRRESVVIYPPVEIKNTKSVDSERNYFLYLGRVVRGKGVDIIVEACSKLGLFLKVAGTGPQLKDLKKFSSENIEFLGEVSDEQRVELFTNAKALIVASEDEDFGITAVESQAVGTPVIAVKTGGYLETVIDKKTGIFFDKATTKSLIYALEKFDQIKFQEAELKKNAEKFSKERFKKEILHLIEGNYKKSSQS